MTPTSAIEEYEDPEEARHRAWIDREMHQQERDLSGGW